MSELAPRILVVGHFVAAPPGGERRMDLFRRQDARQHRVVRPLDARHVHEAGGAADERAAGKDQLRHRLPAALGQRARAIGEALAAFERCADQRVGLEALEFVERRQRRVLVVEMDDEADRDQPIVVMVFERAARGAAAERPAEAVLHQPGLELRRRDPPDLLQADRVFLRLAPIGEPEAGDRLLAERAARAFGEQDVFAAQLHAAGEARLRLAVAADAHVAGRDADDFAVGAIEEFRRGEAGIDLDPERLGAAAHPARHRAERADELAVVAHQLRHHEVGEAHAARRRRETGSDRP